MKLRPRGGDIDRSCASALRMRSIVSLGGVAWRLHKHTYAASWWKDRCHKERCGVCGDIIYEEETEEFEYWIACDLCSFIGTV